MVKSSLLFVGSIVAGLAIGFGVTVTLRAITGDDDLSSAIGTGVWLISMPTIFVYTSLWLTDPKELANSPTPKTTIRGWRAQKAENKLRATELRMGFVFAMIGGATAEMAWDSNLVVTIVTVCCAIAGGLIGFDIRRRVQRTHERFAAHNAEEPI